jgi:hypothetical protein
MDFIAEFSEKKDSTRSKVIKGAAIVGAGGLTGAGTYIAGIQIAGRRFNKRAAKISKNITDGLLSKPITLKRIALHKRGSERAIKVAAKSVKRIIRNSKIGGIAAGIGAGYGAYKLLNRKRKKD